MSSGMNTEQAKEYAKTMTYSEAISNVRYGKGVKYRKATMIKLRELAEIADRLDTADTLQINCETCSHYKLACELFSEICKYEPITQNSNPIFNADDVSLTNCNTCRYGQDKHKYAHICNECGVGINNYTPLIDGYTTVK